MSPTLAGEFFTTESLGKPLLTILLFCILYLDNFEVLYSIHIIGQVGLGDAGSTSEKVLLPRDASGHGHSSSWPLALVLGSLETHLTLALACYFALVS